MISIKDAIAGYVKLAFAEIGCKFQVIMFFIFLIKFFEERIMLKWEHFKTVCDTLKWHKSSCSCQ